MEFTVKRNKCKSTFERGSLGGMQGVPESEISAVIDKVEVAADHFKYRKCFRRSLCIYFVVLLLVSAGIAVHHFRHRIPTVRGQQQAAEHGLLRLDGVRLHLDARNLALGGITQLGHVAGVIRFSHGRQ